ncbi:MAG: hypothetical protein ACR2QC_01620 [Gammaproteobacteria bacterium]
MGASGGEGRAWLKSRTVIKLYHDPEKIRREGLADKLIRLSGLKHDLIVAPRALVVDPRSGKPIGYSMAYVKGESLPNMSANRAWREYKIDLTKANDFITDMHGIVTHAHADGATLCDPNDMNWVVKVKKGFKPYAIDVDSWAIDQWKGTVVVPAVRDYHNPQHFGPLSDWFGWGVITFAFYTGLHPYKGSLEGFGRYDLENRMRANASVFSPNVRLNAAVRDFNTIPGPLLDWYHATFQDGERVVPPNPMAKAVVVPKAAVIQRVVTSGTGIVTHEKLYEAPEDITRVFPGGVVLLESGQMTAIERRSETVLMLPKGARSVEAVRTRGGWFVACCVDTLSRYWFVPRAPSAEAIAIEGEHACQELVRSGENLFITNEKGLAELNIRQFGSTFRPSLGQTWTAMANATKWFDGVGVQNGLGVTFVMIPYASDSGSRAVQKRVVKEMNELRVIEGKAGNRFASFIGVTRDGEYQKVELVFSKDYRSYSIWTGPTDTTDLNLAILEKRVCATIIDDGLLTVFVPSTGNVKTFQDAHVTTALTLGVLDDNVVYHIGRKLYRLRTA